MEIKKIYCDRCKVEAKEKIDASYSYFCISSKTPPGTDIGNFDLCAKCMRDFNFFMKNEVQIAFNDEWSKNYHLETIQDLETALKDLNSQA